jgi:hypothetical protein
MNTHCGNLDQTIPTILEFPKVDGYYGLENLYCRWHIKNKDIGENIFVNFTKYDDSNDEEITIEINYTDGRVSIHNPNLKSFLLIGQEVEHVIFHYKNAKPKPDLPFRISFTSQNVSVDNYIGLGISIASIIIIAFFCAFMLYKCSRLIIANRNVQRRIRIGDGIINSENERLEELKKRNMERLKTLYETELQPIIYNPSLNQYNCNCTICLDEFKGEVQIMKFICKHLFHYNCAQKWFEKNILQPKCPNCNYMLLENDNNPENRESIQNNILILNENRIINLGQHSNQQNERIVTQIVQGQFNDGINVRYSPNMNIEIYNNNNQYVVINHENLNNIPERNSATGPRNNFIRNVYDSTTEMIIQGRDHP